MTALRKYQQNIINQTRNSLKTHKSVLIQGSTGMGKTVLSSFMLKSLADQNKKGLFNCHRRELIKQTSDSFREFDIDHEVIANGYKQDLTNPIQICSVPSLANKLNLIQEPDFIIWDECHHIASSTWGKIFDYFPNAHHIGLTATPQRLDGKGLGKFFEKMIKAPSMRELINQGYLSDFDIYAPSQPDLDGVKSKSGDYDLEELDKAVNKPTITGCAIEHYKKICSGKKGIVFCASINHSLNVVQKFNDEGIKAAHIDGQMTNKQRDELIERFKSGDLKILSNVDIVGEGFDLPAIEVAILLRPTQSLTLYLQQVGRALRRAKGKDKAIILDHAGNVLRHGMPDTEFEWNLDSNLLEMKKEALKTSQQRSCPKCELVVNKVKPICECGYRFGKPQDIIQLAGDLVIVKDTDSYYERTYKKLIKKTYDNFLINPDNGCWDWQLRTKGFNLQIRGVGSKGGKKISKDPKKITFSIFNKKNISDVQVIRNSCGNKACINPEHLIEEPHGTELKRKMDLGLIEKQNVHTATLKKYGKDYYKINSSGNVGATRKKRLLLQSEQDSSNKIFNSQREASDYLQCSKYIIMHFKDTNKPYKGYLIKSYLPF